MGGYGRDRSEIIKGGGWSIELLAGGFLLAGSRPSPLQNTVIYLIFRTSKLYILWVNKISCVL